jgi:DNA-directed RNA polymerase subunit RPC12/RpoP
MSLKCPNCGGQVAYHPQLKKVVCEFCRWETEEGEFSELDGRQDYDRENEKPVGVRGWEKQPEPEFVQDADEIDEFMETNIYHCRTCGAELMLTGTEASTFCSYCGSSTIVFDRVSKEVRPKWIIPFKLTQGQALDSIKKHFAKGDYIPSKIKELTVDKVHAIYMPYWLFDTYIRRSMVVEASTHEDGTFEYVRDASCRYTNMTLDASLRLNNEMSRRLEPFHTEELVEFDVVYLSGFYADRYDVSKESLKTANVRRCREYLDDAILDTCPRVNKRTIGTLSNYTKKDVREEYQIENADYALLPAYFVNLKYDTGRELVMVNGQTGKVVANLPFEKKQIVKKFLKNSLIACFIFTLLTYGCLIMNAYPALLILAAITGFMVAGGISGYNKYKLGKCRMSASSMKSYINDREDII